MTLHAFWIAVLFVTPLCAQQAALERVDVPASSHSLAPNLSFNGEHFILSWIEREAGSIARLRTASWNGSAFDAPRTVASSRKMFANWADIPVVVEAPSGDLYASWLEKISGKDFAYGIRLMRSTDKGVDWKQIGWLHQDESPTEHGFVSFVAEGQQLRAFWLDGREMVKEGGRMMLRTAVLDGDKIKGEHIVDDDVCTCCPTSAAKFPSGSIVAYRDRSAKEIRDISIARKIGAEWSQWSVIPPDNWFMPGCPVNGPSVAVQGELVATTRFTVFNGKPQVILNLSNKDATDYGREVVLDDAGPIGRCITVIAKGAIYVLWIADGGKGATLQLAKVNWNGEIKSKTALVKIEGARSSGMPRAVFSDGYLWVTWTDAGRVKLGRVKVGS
ncbi:MAG: hypothetical protein GXP30_05140 [Verrucomicrobia bacterium]|nr:hypothetical protein [Verrucomicrobiota bacterium]